MRKLKDILEIPIESLEKSFKDFIHMSFEYWTSQINAHLKNIAETKEDDKEELVEESGSEIAKDLAIIVELNKAIVEKYQATGAESLLKYLASQLAKERGCSQEEVKDEIEKSLEVSPEKRELLELYKSERAEFVASKVINENPDSITKIMNGDTDIIKDLDKEAVKKACGIINVADLKYALRALIRIEINNLQGGKSDA